MRMTVGGCEANLKRAVSRPRMFMSSSLTILTICSAGERAVATWEPMAFSRMCSTVSLTTSRLTSDSRRARRISRRASAMFSSVMVPWPRRVLKERWSLSLRFSNMMVCIPEFISGAEAKADRGSRGGTRIACFASGGVGAWLGGYGVFGCVRGVGCGWHGIIRSYAGDRDR